jgi:1,4-alpha-glucan branching enzyme
VLSYSLMNDFDIIFSGKAGILNYMKSLVPILLVEMDDQKGTFFGVWAPNATKGKCIGNFNGWNHNSHKLFPDDGSGIWEGFIPELGMASLQISY